MSKTSNLLQFKLLTNYENQNITSVIIGVEVLFMKTKNLFSVYLMLGIMGAITTQALPIVYSSYGLSSNQIYNLISIVFLATAFQPLLGMIIDRFFSQERGISLLFGLVGVVSIGLIFINTYPIILFVILLLSIFRIPLFPIMDGYSAGQVQKYHLNMGLIRAGSTIGFGVGMAVLMLFLNLFNLTPNFSFLFMAILAFAAVIIIELSNRKEAVENQLPASDSKQSVVEDDTETKWDLVVLLVIMQIAFFGFTILKVNYTTPFLVENGFTNNVIATTTIIGMIPIFVLMPLFGKIFNKFKFTTIFFFGILANVIQTSLFLLFPTSLGVIMLGSFFNGFIFPLYTPVFGMLLRKGLNSKYISTGFTTIFTIQNLFVFFFNQFVVINILNITNTISTAYIICLGFFGLSLIPLLILRLKKY